MVVDKVVMAVVKTVCPALTVLVAKGAPFKLVANSTFPRKFTASGKVAIRIPELAEQTLLKLEVIDEGALL